MHLYRDSRTPCLPARRTCHAGQWVGRMPSCVPFDYCERPPIIRYERPTADLTQPRCPIFGCNVLPYSACCWVEFPTKIAEVSNKKIY